MTMVPYTSPTPPTTPGSMSRWQRRDAQFSLEMADYQAKVQGFLTALKLNNLLKVTLMQMGLTDQLLRETEAALRDDYDPFRAYVKFEQINTFLDLSEQIIRKEYGCQRYW